MENFKRAREAYDCLADLRQRRRRYKRYTYGDQWSDPADSRRVSSWTEADAARAQGQTPHTNNLLRQLVKCVIGNFRNSLLQPQGKDAAPKAPDPVADRNLLTEMDCRMLEEFLISGCAIQRVVCESRPAGAGVWVDNVSPENFFVNRFEDPRGHDIQLIGMLHSMSVREVTMRFARNNDRAIMGRISRAYGAIESEFPAPRAAVGRSAGSSFLHAGGGLCRVIEVWTLRSVAIVKCHDRHEGRLFTTSPSQLRSISELNLRREAAGLEGIDTRNSISMRWHCTFYTPLGEILADYDSPYRHGMHPFVVKFYPMIDGEVHSLVEDLIDQQRCVNSLITLVDQIMRVSAKGVLLFPIDQKVNEFTWEDIAKLWAKPNAIIPYRAGRTGSSEPHQVVSPADHSGAYRLLETQLSLFQQISGVSEAMQGRLPQANTSAALFDSQLRSSTVALLDLIDSFNSFRTARNRIMQSV
ncbi:MAG: hypothetical protein HDS07_08730 [Bacteroides sp.]|nr:hypothetical protein [Bacteroides sp.]